MELLQAELAKRQSGSPQLLKELEKLISEMERAKATPGHKSESRKKPEPKPRGPQTGHGPTEQPQLRMEEVVHKLDDADRPCPDCGKEMPEWEGQFETAEVIDVVVREHVRKVHKRQKYHCSCGHIETALGEPRLVGGGRYSDGFIIQRLVEKYMDHLPLERQVRILAREGLEVTSQTLWDQMLALHKSVLTPVLTRLMRYQAAKPVRHGDETRWPMLGKEAKNWTMWADCSEDAVVYMILDGRSTEMGDKLFGNVNGVLMVDGYLVYPALAKKYPSIRIVNCWAHVRRKILELEDTQPEVKTLLDLIGQLFHIDKDGPPEERLLRRQQRSRKVLTEIQQWILDKVAMPETPLRGALQYIANRWTGLTRFVDDASIPLDNNLAERCLRGPVIGRHNHYGSKSRQGTEVAAAAYSIMESAKLNGLNPEAYLLVAVKAFHAGAEIPLPHEVKALSA